MTFEDYILNPMGKQNAVLSAITRESIRTNYTYRFDNILLREGGKIQYYKYKTSNNEYIIHIKIPSEPVKKFYYDVVLKFFANDDVKGAGKNLLLYNFQAFSNDPAFVYNHAYVFKMNNLFFTDMTSKMGKRPLKEEPKVKNPDKVVAYVKSIYFAYLYMKNRGLFKTIAWADAAAYDKKTLLNNVMSCDEKIALREEKEKEINHKKKIVVDDNLANRLSRSKQLSDTDKDRLVVRTTKKVPTVKKIKAVNSTRRLKKR